MLILPFALVLGVLVGLATRGTWRALAELRFRRPLVVVGAIAAQAALGLPEIRDWPSGMRFAILCASYAAIGCWVVDNARSNRRGVRVGLGLVGVGWLANAVAIVANGGMPVSGWAMRAAGIRPSTSVRAGHLSKHVLASHVTAVRALGDVIPVSFFRAVVSPGDVVMAVGIVVLVVAAMHGSVNAVEEQVGSPVTRPDDDLPDGSRPAVAVGAAITQTQSCRS